MNKIMNTIKNHKKLAVALLLLITVSVIGTIIVLNKPKTIEQPKVAETKQEVKDEKKTSTKEDKKSDEKKNEDKKSDEKKTDVKPEATATPSNNATVEETNNTASNDVSNNTTSNSTSNDNVPAPCVPTYTTVNHPAVGHYEQREIMPAYNKPIYETRIVGLVTGRIYNSLDEFYAQDEDGNYTVTQVQVDTEYVPAVYDNVWVEDQPAYTTTEASGC